MWPEGAVSSKGLLSRVARYRNTSRIVCYTSLQLAPRWGWGEWGSTRHRCWVTRSAWSISSSVLRLVKVRLTSMGVEPCLTGGRAISEMFLV